MATKTIKPEYFAGIDNIEDLKQLYHGLAFTFHPDMGGDLETMQIINAEFDYFHALLKDTHKKQDGTLWSVEKEERKTKEMPEDFREIIDRLITLADIELEVCGNWIWVTGDTKNYKDLLKELRFWFSAPKKAWYYNGQVAVKKHRAHCKDMNQVRSIWGSTKFEQEVAPQLN